MPTGAKETIGIHLQKSGVSRRSFLELCSKIIVAAPVGLALTHKATAAQVAKLVSKARRPSVIWLHFQDCTGCTETLLRTSAPDVAHLILDVISLDYHETLMAASGAQHCDRRLRTMPASTCWSSRAQFPRGTTAYTWNWRAARRFRC